VPKEVTKVVDREVIKYVEVKVEKPVEVIKYVDREVIKEVPKEVIKYVDREVIKEVKVEVVKEVKVEVPGPAREVIREVYVDRPTSVRRRRAKQAREAPHRLGNVGVWYYGRGLVGATGRWSRGRPSARAPACAVPLAGGAGGAARGACRDHQGGAGGGDQRGGENRPRAAEEAAWARAVAGARAGRGRVQGV